MTTVAGAVTVSSVAPNQGAQGAAVPVTITGTGFAAGATVGLSGTGVTASNVAVGSATQITATLTIAGGAALGARDVTVTNSNGGTVTLTGGFTVASAAPTTATLTLAYNGKLRDRVGQSETALGPDGTPDATLTATLSASGGRTVTAVRLGSDWSTAPGVWLTSSPGTGHWVLAVAPTLDGAVLNAPGTLAVNFPVADGGSFVVFAADYLGSEFLPGRTLTLTATFSDGSTAIGTITVPSAAPLVNVLKPYIQPGSFNAYSATAGGGTHYVENTDFAVGYQPGMFVVLAGGAIAAGGTVYITYKYGLPSRVAAGEIVAIDGGLCYVSMLKQALRAVNGAPLQGN